MAVPASAREKYFLLHRKYSVSYTHLDVYKRQELINQVDPRNLIIMSDGKALSLITELDDKERDYLSKTPNADIFKLFFARRCILVEGLTEELLIKAYLQSKPELSDIEVISFHKGFTKILDIWCTLNDDTANRLGIIRDFDDEPTAKAAHDNYNAHPRICVQTTKEYTLEPEVVKTGDNYDLLLQRYGACLLYTSRCV